MKPDPKIYEILLKRYKIVPEQALFFDDRLKMWKVHERWA